MWTHWGPLSSKSRFTLSCVLLFRWIYRRHSVVICRCIYVAFSYFREPYLMASRGEKAGTISCPWRDTTGRSACTASYVRSSSLRDHLAKAHGVFLEPGSTSRYFKPTATVLEERLKRIKERRQRKSPTERRESKSDVKRSSAKQSSMTSRVQSKVIVANVKSGDRTGKTSTPAGTSTVTAAEVKAACPAILHMPDVEPESDGESAIALFDVECLLAAALPTSETVTSAVNGAAPTAHESSALSVSEGTPSTVIECQSAVVHMLQDRSPSTCSSCSSERLLEGSRRR